jgi:hypothetical protein
MATEAASAVQAQEAEAACLQSFELYESESVRSRLPVMLRCVVTERFSVIRFVWFGRGERFASVTLAARIDCLFVS